MQSDLDSPICPLCGRKWKYKLIDGKWVKQPCECSSTDEASIAETL